MFLDAMLSGTDQLRKLTSACGSLAIASLMPSSSVVLPIQNPMYQRFSHIENQHSTTLQFELPPVADISAGTCTDALPAVNSQIRFPPSIRNVGSQIIDVITDHPALSGSTASAIDYSLQSSNPPDIWTIQNSPAIQAILLFLHIRVHLFCLVNLRVFASVAIALEIEPEPPPNQDDIFSSCACRNLYEGSNSM